MTWVRFHGELRQGEKRGLSRATRFVYLELSHEARPRQGVVVLPQRMGDVDAVHEVLAGNRKEVAEAVRDLTEGPDPMVRFEERDGKRVLVVVNWEKWNPKRDDSGPRVKLHRDNKRRATESPPSSDGNALHDASETLDSESHIPRARALISSPLSLDSSSSPESSSKIATADESESGVRLRAAPDVTIRPCPDELPAQTMADLCTNAPLCGWPDPRAEWPQFRAHRRATNTLRADYGEDFKLWLGRGKGFTKGKPGSVERVDVHSTPEAVDARQRERDRRDAELRAKSVPMPAEFSAVVGVGKRGAP